LNKFFPRAVQGRGCSDGIQSHIVILDAVVHVSRALLLAAESSLLEIVVAVVIIAAMVVDVTW
jgi:hypothetical protein